MIKKNRNAVQKIQNMKRQKKKVHLNKFRIKRISNNAYIILLLIVVIAFFVARAISKSKRESKRMNNHKKYISKMKDNKK